MFINLKKINFNFVTVTLFLIVAAYFRFTSLGYSDLQGDEVKPFAYRDAPSFINFLLGNSKGPGQYLVVWTSEFFDKANNDMEFHYRLPFAVAGFFSVFFFYIIAKKYFNSKVGFYALTIAALNGFFIAFSRIVQYQSFKLLLVLVSTYFFLYFLKKLDRKYLVLSGISIAAAFLFHYDALTLLIVQSIILFSKSDKIKNYLIYFASFSIALIFYIPYTFNENFKYTLSYILHDRTIAEFSYDSVFYSEKLSSIYFSKEYLVIVGVLAIVSFWKLQSKNLLCYRSALVVLILLVISRYFVEHPYKPLILLSTLVSSYLMYLIFINKDIRTIKKYIHLWFLISFTIYVLVIGKPLTHIYNAYLPLTFIAALQLNRIKSKYIKLGLLAILVVSSISFNYHAYIENKLEYPWQLGNYIFGKMYQGISQGEVVRGIFGFPYYRSLDMLDSDLNSVIDKSTTPTFNTNIKYPRLMFYINSIHESGLPEKDYYIDVKDDRDYESNDFDIHNSPKTNLFENSNYIIYSLP